MFEVLLNTPKLERSVLKLAVFAGLLLFTHPAFATPDRVTVAWDANPEPDISGYQVYYGTVSAGSTNVVPVIGNTQQEIAGLQPQQQYWFYVTAKNTAGLESDPSTILFYTTADNAPPTVTLGDGTRLVIAPAVIRPKAIAADDYLTPEELAATWTQISGPSVSIGNGDQLQPNIQITAAGTYQFRVTVNDGSNSAFDEIQLSAYETGGTPPPGSVVPDIQFVASTFDGMIIAWDSAPGKTYHIGFKDDLNDPSWLIIGSSVPSMGYTTYWVDDRGYTSSTGFFGIFQVE